MARRAPRRGAAGVDGPPRHPLLGSHLHARMPTLERPLQPLNRRVVALQHDPADLAASAMIATLIQRHPAELSCPRTVRTAVDVFAVRGRRRLSVALKARVVAAEACAEGGAQVVVVHADGPLPCQRRQQVGARPFAAAGLKGRTLAIVGRELSGQPLVEFFVDQFHDRLLTLRLRMREACLPVEGVLNAAGTESRFRRGDVLGERREAGADGFGCA